MKTKPRLVNLIAARATALGGSETKVSFLSAAGERSGTRGITGKVVRETH